MLHFFFAAATTDTVRCNAVYSWRRRWALHCRRKRCLSAAVGTCAALHNTAGGYAGFFVSSLHMFGQPLPVTERLLQFAEILRFIAFNSASGDQPV